MKIQLISDLHLEFYSRASEFNHTLDQLRTDADILIAAGDIHVGRTNTISVLHKLADHYSNVVYVPGNHEYYHGVSLEEFNYKHFASKLPANVHVLNPSTLYFHNVAIIGATLWTDFDNDPIAEQIAKGLISDFRRSRITVEQMREAFKYHSEYIWNSIDATDMEHIIVVTHFMPSPKLVHPKWRLDPRSRMLNKYFAPDMRLESIDKPITWLYGHTHDRSVQQIGNVRCIANPLGYPNEINMPYTPLTLEFPKYLPKSPIEK